MQTTSDFCCAAARKLLQYYSVKADEIGAIVFVSQCADYRTPSTACVIQSRLGCKSYDCIAFDVNLGCSGFIYGLNIISAVMNNSDINKALLLCGDTFAKPYYHNREVRESHSSKYLFGDAGAAILLEKSHAKNCLNIASCTDGNRYKAIIDPYNFWRHPDAEGNGGEMDDIAVFNFSTSEAPKMIKEYMERMHKTPDDYDMLILHQANLMIMKQVTKRAGFPDCKMGVSIDQFGNTSSASIPLTLVKEFGMLESNEVKKFMTCGFGVGLSWGACELELSSSQILPLIHTNEFYDDGYNNM